MNTRRIILCLVLIALCVAGAGQALAFYNPGTGRWLNKDPLEEGGGLNIYAYCQNDGIDFYDPTGLDFIDNNKFALVNSLPHEFGHTRVGMTLQLGCSSSCKMAIKKFDIRIV